MNSKNSCLAWGKNRKLSWKTWKNGELVPVEALSGDHAFVLTGWIGDKNNPTHIKLYDTQTGLHTYPTEEWMRKWSLMQNRSLAIADTIATTQTDSWMGNFNSYKNSPKNTEAQT